MNILSKLHVPFVCLALAASGSARAVGECPRGLIPVTEFRLFFGLADAAGKVVTEDEWERFLADTVTPRLQAGLTVFEGKGQWLEPSGNLQRESVKVIVGAVTSDVDEGMKLVDEISEEFRTRFNQDPVFRMSDTACAGIHQQKP